MSLKAGALLFALAALGVASCTADGVDGPPTGTSSNNAPASTTAMATSSNDIGSITTVPASTVAPPPQGGGRIEHPSGFTLTYPHGWSEAGPSIATEFAAEAECVAAKIVDFLPPVDSGQAEAGFVLESVVQVCAQPVDGRSLEVYLREVYGDAFATFAEVEIGGVTGYRIDEGLSTVGFTQGATHRFQIATSVAADPDLEGERVQQVRDIVESMTLG